MDVIRHCLYITNSFQLKNGNVNDVKYQLQSLLEKLPKNSMLCPIYTDWTNLECFSVNHNNAWISVTSTTTPDDLYPQEILSLEGNEESKSSKGNLCDLLHTIADNLPLAGSVIDVIVDFSKVSDLDDDVVPVLHGILKRFHLWLCASIFIIYIPDAEKDTSYTNNIDLLLEVWTVECLPSLDQVTISQDLAWKGNILLVDKQNAADCCFSGFALKTTKKSFPVKVLFNRDEEGSSDIYSNNTPQIKLGSHMKILDVVDVHTIPHFAVCPQLFKLVLVNQNEKAHKFLNYLSGCDQLAIIVAVPNHSAEHGVTSYKTSELNTVAWKEYILSDFTQDIIYANSSKDGDFTLFVLVPRNRSHKSNSLDSNTDDDNLPNHYCVDAYMMRSAEEFNGEIFDHMYLNYSPPPTKYPVINIPDLPVFNKKILSKISAYLTKSQTFAIKQHLKDSSDPSSMLPEELFPLLSNVQKRFLENLKGKLKHEDCSQTFDALPSQCQSNELDFSNCAQWPEKHYIQQLESMKKTICRFRSFDSMSISSPYVPLQDVVPTEIEEILSHFQEDGSATNISLTPLLSQHNLRSFVFPAFPDEFETCLMKWPQCREARFPGVSYNKGNRCEKIQTRLNKLRDKFITADTSTTCSLQNCRSLSLQSTNNPWMAKNFLSENSYRIKRNSSITNLEVRSMSDTNFQTSRNVKQMKLPGVITRHNSAKEILGISSTSIKQSQINSAVKSSKTSIQANVNEIKKKPSRSERHKQKLESIVKFVLKQEGLSEKDEIFPSCFQRLFKVTKIYVMDLPDSRKLGQEMRRLAESQVKYVVEIETQRQKSLNSKKNQKGSQGIL
ncbi:mdm2-binding protein-like [Argonauta hians]